MIVAINRCLRWILNGSSSSERPSSAIAFVEEFASRHSLSAETASMLVSQVNTPTVQLLQKLKAQLESDKRQLPTSQAPMMEAEQAVARLACLNSTACAKVLDLQTKVASLSIELEALKIRLDMAKRELQNNVDRCTSLALVIFRSQKSIELLGKQKAALEQARTVVESDDYGEKLLEGTNPSPSMESGETLPITGVGSARAVRARSDWVRLEGVKEYHPISSDPSSVLEQIDKLEGDEKMMKKFRSGVSPSGSRCDAISMCSGRGDCLWDSLSHTFYCECRSGYFGESCNEKRCPKNCSGHGDCVNGECMCNPNFCGNLCSKSCRSESAKKLYEIANHLTSSP